MRSPQRQHCHATPRPQSSEKHGQETAGGTGRRRERGSVPQSNSGGREPGALPEKTRVDAEGPDLPAPPPKTSVRWSSQKGVGGWRMKHVQPCFPPEIPGATLQRTPKKPGLPPPSIQVTLHNPNSSNTQPEECDYYIQQRKHNMSSSVHK